MPALSKETWARMSKKEKTALLKALLEYKPPNTPPFWHSFLSEAELKAIDDAAVYGTGFVRIVGPESIVRIKPREFYIKAEPEPYYWNLPSWIWKRATGWRDDYGRKAQLFPFPWFDWNPM